MPNVLMSGTAQKAADDTIRLPCDWGDFAPLIDGASVVDDALVMSVNIASYDVACALLVVSGKQLDYGYQTSAKISGGTAGTTYDIVYSIVLDDADASTFSRTGPLKVL